MEKVAAYNNFAVEYKKSPFLMLLTVTPFDTFDVTVAATSHVFLLR